MKKVLALTLVALFAALALSGCAQSQIVKTGFVGSSGNSAWSGRFASYRGFEEKRVSGGGNIMCLDYKLAAESGRLRVSVETPDGTPLFSADTGQGDAAYDARFPLTGDNTVFILRVTGERAKNGSFQLEWRFE